MKRHARKLLAAGISLLCIFVLPLSHASGSPPEEAPVIVVNDRTDVAATVDLWNRAVRAAQSKNWEGLASLLTPEESRWWQQESVSKKTDQEIAIRTVWYGREINEENTLVLTYRQPDGQTFARIYSEATRDIRGREAMYRNLRATIVGNKSGAKEIHKWFLDQHPFGIGQVIAGIRLDARAAIEKISSWKKFAMVLRFTNTSASESIAISASPRFRLGCEFDVGVLDAVPAESAKAFNVWFGELAARHSVELVGLIDSRYRSHEPVLLGPGETYEFDLRLADLCWGSENVPDGPTGTFRLFVTYDPNLERDPFEAAAPAWRHRVASSEFVVTVDR